MSSFVTCIGTDTILTACAIKNRMTAIVSCVHRKKSGTYVEFNTHLFLKQT